MWLRQVLLPDSGLPISSAHALKFNTTLLVCVKDKMKCIASSLQHKRWSMGIKSEKKESLLVLLHVKTY